MPVRVTNIYFFNYVPVNPTKAPYLWYMTLRITVANNHILYIKGNSRQQKIESESFNKKTPLPDLTRQKTKTKKTQSETSFKVGQRKYNQVTPLASNTQA